MRGFENKLSVSTTYQLKVKVGLQENKEKNKHIK